MAMNIKPLGDKLVAKPIEEEEVKKGGIIIPDTAKEKSARGTVVAIGSGKLLENGQRAAMSVKVGDKILFNDYSPKEVKIDGDIYLILSEEDVLGIIV